MLDSPRVTVHIDLRRIRENARSIAGRAGVPLWATIKADAYGLGAARVAQAIAHLVHGFCLFSLAEATDIDLWQLTARPAIALGPPATLDPAPWLAAHVRPSVTTAQQARALAAARPVFCVDTGMQRFACPPADVPAILATGAIDQAFTHGTRVEHARRLRELTASHPTLELHAAGTALLDEPDARMSLVRPGLALYAGAVRVTTPLLEVRRSAGPIGYQGWENSTGHHGAILAGYAHGLRPGPVIVNGRRQRIAEVGMQSAYVTLDPADRPGDLVTLLGLAPTQADLAFAWGVAPHQVLVTMAGLGTRTHHDSL